MKSMIIATVLLLSGCSTYECARLASYKSADSATQAKRAAWVTETVRAAHQQLSAGDYEDAEEIIPTAHRASRELFPDNTVTVGLVKYGITPMTNGATVYERDIILHQNLGPRDLGIYDSLVQSRSSVIDIFYSELVGKGGAYCSEVVE